MNVSRELVERIVREVLAGKPRPGAQEAATPADVVRLTEAVVTGDLLEQKAAAATAVELPAKAILTPSARDFLRRGNVAVRTASAAAVKAAAGSSWLVVQSGGADVPGLVKSLPDWRAEISGTLAEAAAFVQRNAARGPGRFAVLTERPEAFCVLANREAAVVAVPICDAARLPQAVAVEGANAFAIETGRLGGFQLRRVLGRLPEVASAGDSNTTTNTAGAA